MDKLLLDEEQKDLPSPVEKDSMFGSIQKRMKRDLKIDEGLILVAIFGLKDPLRRGI